MKPFPLAALLSLLLFSGCEKLTDAYLSPEVKLCQKLNTWEYFVELPPTTPPANLIDLEIKLRKIGYK